MSSPRLLQRAVFLAALALLGCGLACAETLPAGFSWITAQSNPAAMASVRSALRGAKYARICKAGIASGYALVMVSSTSCRPMTTDSFGDEVWSVYNISLASNARQLLLSGHAARLFGWIGSQNDEFAIAYYDCWNCEADRLFTTLHLFKGRGWQARWPHQSDMPGLLAESAGNEDSPEETYTSFKVMLRPDRGIDVLSILRYVNIETNKTAYSATHGWIDPRTGQEHTEKIPVSDIAKWKKVMRSTPDLVRLR